MTDYILSNNIYTPSYIDLQVFRELIPVPNVWLTNHTNMPAFLTTFTHIPTYLFFYKNRRLYFITQTWLWFNQLLHKISHLFEKRLHFCKSRNNAYRSIVGTRKNSRWILDALLESEIMLTLNWVLLAHFLPNLSIVKNNELINFQSLHVRMMLGIKG